MIANTGRIENEPAEVYFGPADKPKFGGTAIKCWVTDPELFYRRYISLEDPQPEAGRAMVVGSALDWLVTQPERDASVHRMHVSEFKTATSKGFQEEVAAHPDKYVLTMAEHETVVALYDVALADGLTAIADVGQTQVTYRVDKGPFYLQARIDIEAANDLVDEETIEDAMLGPDFDRLLIDLKTTASHWGQYGFPRTCMRSPLHYPIQQALYQLVVSTVLQIDPAKLPFRFAAISETGLRWYDLFDFSMAANNRVVDAIGLLANKMRMDDWSEYRSPGMRIMVPENYLSWTTEN